ncbi:MAG: ATP-binding protein [Bacillota bacterium]|uniref:ATP-binding protein n=1 Tax=Butyricicoccus sp. TaxID=2049021 RepID=UPI00270C611C|nr:ATP-binding protein [Bacillota bacterium]
MNNTVIGHLTKITGSKITIRIVEKNCISKVDVADFSSSYVSIGTLIGVRLVDGRDLVLLVEEIYENNHDVYATAAISGIYDSVTQKFSFGTNAYPLVGECAYKLDTTILKRVFTLNKVTKAASIGTYVYDPSVPISYDPNVMFGKHLGVFGNTGSGKTCTVVSLIQQYIHSNPDSDIKFIILDVNGEYKAAFDKKEMDFIEFEKLRFHHSMLSNSEYGRLFRAAEGVQYPAIKSCISALAAKNKQWDMRKLPNQIEEWINENTPQNQKGEKDVFSKNNISGHLRTMSLRIDSVLNDSQLMSVINTAGDEQTIDTILKSPKPVVVIDLQVSSDTLDVVLYLMFKALYERKSKRVDTTHICLVLEEAHRYINTGAEESKLGSYYIDKLAREGRKFGVGLIISSQVPSLLSYEIVSQCNSVVMHKINSKKDLEFLKNVLRVSSDNFHQQMSALEKQYAIVCGEAFPNDTVVKIHDASPRPASSDPVIEDRFLPNTPSDEDELPF